MKHVCVAARIGDGKAPGAGNSHSIAKTSNVASADSGCNPKGLARVLACSPRLSAKGFCSWGGDGGQVAHVHSVGYGAVPANGPAANESRRHFVASHLLRMTKPRVLLRILSQNRDSASRVSFCNGLLSTRSDRFENHVKSILPCRRCLVSPRRCLDSRRRRLDAAVGLVLRRALGACRADSINAASLSRASARFCAWVR